MPQTTTSTSPIDHDTARLTQQLAAIVGLENVATTEAERLVYETDGFTMARRRPAAVVHPANTEQVQQIVRLANELGIPFVARGAGTGLSGGAMAPEGGIIISITRMREILEVDLRNRRIRAQAGVVNLRLSQHVASKDYHYAPDPSSQMACTIGGNVAENAGGPHTLKYGVTTNHLLGLLMVLPDGNLLEVDASAADPAPGYDLPGIITGSEGTFGIITEVTVKLTRLPEARHTALAVFDTVDDATRCVSDIIASGIVPAALEMMDQTVIRTVEAAMGFGFPTDAQAVLIIELDGVEEGLDELGAQVKVVCDRNNAREVRVAEDEAQRQRLWMSRKKAVGSLGRITPSHCTQDGVIPRSKLPEVLREISQIGTRFGLRIANVFHAGDGNLHPIILYDDRDPEEVKRVLECGGEILKVCVGVGGAITGEHGVGVEKLDFMHLMFSEHDLETMARIRSVFNPDEICNPGKVIPTRTGCIELMLGKKMVS